MTRSRSDAYLDWVRHHGCLACAMELGSVRLCPPAGIAHHLMHSEPSAMGARSGDEWAVPLCRLHHDDLHRFGDEAAWWALKGIHPEGWAQRSWNAWGHRRRSA